MNESKAKFVDRTGFTARDIDLWPAVVITRQEIEAEADRLAALPAPENGRRSSLIVHPRAAEQGQGLAPAIQVSLDVLKPGERTRAIRHNSTVANFCIRGAGHSIVNGKRIAFSRYDVWNAPSMAIYQHVNDTDEIQVRLAYSNAALLEKLNIHFVEDDPPPVEEVAEARTQKGDERRAHPFGTFQLTPEGAQLMPYEKLVAPDAVESNALHWPWKMVKAHLDKLESLGKDYVGRRLYLLYNPMTGRTNGTTPCFFTTMCLRPPNIVDRPHRHTSAAINYYFAGSGRSTVEGKVYEWSAGDLMLSAPGWGVHNHASYDEPVYELTVQDMPLNIAMESLLWQESMKHPMAVLGAETGFATNREAVTG